MATEDMANQEVGGHRGKIFNIGAPPKETPTVNVPKSKPEVDISPKRPKRERRRLATGEKIKKGLEIVRNATLAGVAVGSLGLAAQHHVEYQKPLSPQGIARDFGSIPSTAVKDYNWLIQKLHPKLAPIVPEILNNKVDKQYIQAGVNLIPITYENLPSLLKDTIKPLEKDSFPDVAILNPFKIDNSQIIEMSTKYVQGILSPVTGKPDLLPGGKEFIVPNSGTEIVIPVEGAEIFKLNPYIVDGKPYFNGIDIQFYGPDGTRFDLVIASPSDIRQLVPMDSIKESPVLGPTDWARDTDSFGKGKGLSLPAGTTILKTSGADAKIAISLHYSSNPHSTGWGGNFSIVTDPQTGKGFYLPTTNS